MNTKCSGVFILGTDTEVGKTFQAAALAKQLVSQGRRVGVYKPAASGVVAGEASDPEILRAAAGLGCPLDRVCPQQLAAACAPPIAARMESKTIDEQLLISGAHWWFERCEFLIVEGVGGALAPLSDTMKVLDLAEILGFPTILIAANRLGVVNHTLLTLEAIAARQLQNVGIVLNTLPVDIQAGGRTDISLDSNATLLRQFAPGIPIESSISALTLPGLSMPTDSKNS